jgi:pyridoxal phosphate enzyme (YggS family)
MHVLVKHCPTMPLNTIRSRIQSSGATLVAVSKTHPVTRIRALYEQGLRDFGENRVQELLEKAPQLPSDIRWHLIGHLQRNKVKQIAPLVYLIHSVDSLALLQEIEKQGERNGLKIRVLFQYHIAQEKSKFGISPQEDTWLRGLDFAKDFPHIIPSGVMGMATFTDDEEQIRLEFRQLKALFDTLRGSTFSRYPSFREISMGMSSDYNLALAEGSTMVRIGSLIFGDRS